MTKDAERASMWRLKAAASRQQATKMKKHGDLGWAWHFTREANRFESFAARYERKVM